MTCFSAFSLSEQMHHMREREMMDTVILCMYLGLRDHDALVGLPTCVGSIASHLTRHTIAIISTALREQREERDRTATQDQSSPSCTCQQCGRAYTTSVTSTLQKQVLLLLSCTPFPPSPSFPSSCSLCCPTSPRHDPLMLSPSCTCLPACPPAAPFFTQQPS